MKRLPPFALVTILALLLSGCGVPYGKDGGYGGYSDGPVEKSLYHVTFTSPGGLDDGAIHDLALLRAAEVCRDHGYTSFTVVRENKGYTPRAALAPQPDAYIYAAHPVWVPGPPGHGPTLVMVQDPFGPPASVAISARFAELYVRGGNDNAGYNVAKVIAGTRAKYKLGPSRQ